MATFIALLAIVWCRAAQLHVTHGAAFRAEAVRPIEQERLLPAQRGRILARDGTVLACDQVVTAVAVDYRWLEDPPRQAWLEQRARKRLPKDQRRNVARRAEEVARLRQERDDLHRRLAALCQVDLADWQARRGKMQERVEQLAADVRRRQFEASRVVAPQDNARWQSRLLAVLGEIFAPARDAVPEAVTVAEEHSDHVLAEDISAAAIEEIQSHSERYPGTRIVQLTRRAYPHGTLAAHVIGYLGHNGHGGSALASSLDPPYAYWLVPPCVVGITGIEQQGETRLCGRPGLLTETLDRAGRVAKTACPREPAQGGDVTLTLDLRLQQAAEELLDSGVKRAAMQSGSRKPAGGAIIVMDVHSGDILALASAPRFDPAVFGGKDSAGRAALLADAGSPLLHRAMQMALPPGSVFKALTAAALLESGGLDPLATFHCQGYLDRPDQLRCAIFVRHGTGHGDVTLADALAESCNVYFFHHVEALPPDALADWARRFGFGQATGIDLPGEVRGTVPANTRTSDVQAMAIGQGALTATPLQVVRMMAAIANDGLLVAPHVLRSDTASAAARPIPGLTFTSLAAIRAGLLQSVAGKNGTAHETLYLPQIAIAGKTGTATIGGLQPEHAWFAGYVPAEKPRYAMVVVLERAGDAAVAACPVAKRLVLKMIETGVLR